MTEATQLKSNWLTALSACNLSPRGLARETGISHTYLYRIIGGHIIPSEVVKSRLLSRLRGYTADELFDQVVPALVSSVIICKRCHSTHIIRSGVFKGGQRYQCKDCGCVFINNQCPLHGRVPIKSVVFILEHFFNGEPPDSIRIMVEDLEQVQITLQGLESLVSRFAKEAVRLADDIMPSLSPLWILESTFIPAVKPATILDVIDMNTGFIIATDLIPPYIEKERENVVQKALRITNSKPEKLVMGPELGAEKLDLELGGEKKLPEVSLEENQSKILLKYNEKKAERTQLVIGRLNRDGLLGGRLICSAWRIHYNFLSDLKPAGECRYPGWLNIVNGIPAT